MSDRERSANRPVEAAEISRQIRVELGILLGIEQALRGALEWRTLPRGNSRKVSTLRYHVGSFERHMTRVHALADHGGYLNIITETNPRLSSQVSLLRNQRANLHMGIERIVVCLDLIATDDGAGLTNICNDLEVLLNNLREHGQNEFALLQESAIREVGGSG